MNSKQKQASPGEKLFLLSAILATLVVVIGVMVLLGWVAGLELLKNPFPDEPPVAISTALCLMLSGITVLLKRAGREPLVRLCSFSVIAICSLILCHYLFASFDLDQFFHGKSLAPLGPDRMAPSILFSLLSVNIAALLNHKRYVVLVDFLVLFASVLCLTAFAARSYDVPKLMRISTIIQMASTAAVGGLLVSWSLLLLRPDRGIVSVLSSPSMGGRFGRQYILAAIILPFVVGLVALHGLERGLYDSRLGTALVVLTTVCFMVSMLFRVSGWLNEAERQRDRAQEDMRSNIENTRLIVDAATDAFMMIDKDGKIVDWNPAAERMLGWSRAEALGRSFEFALAPQERELHLANISEYVGSGHSEKLNQRLELNLLRRDGTEVMAEGSPFAVQAREDLRLCAFLHDISGRKESERRINEFVSTVSHELRTPLTSIKGALRLIEGGLAGDVSSEAMSLINVASSETERLVRLVNDILDLKKIEAGKLELKFEETQLNTLVDEALEGIQGMATEFGIVLAREIKVSGSLYCDRDRIIQVLHNLLSNSIKFSPEGETVMLSLEVSGGTMLRFSVIDNGFGIPENQIHKLFGRFQQLDSSDSRQQGGTGLGLAISKAIVEEHKGKIGFQTTYGEGSRFWFELPMQPEHIS